MKIIVVTLTEIEWTPFPKLGSDVKTDDATYAPGGHKEPYGSHNEAFWGEQGGLPGRSGMG